jgi:hypothetical protein
MLEQLTALLIDYYAARTQAPVSEADRERLAVIARANLEECDENPIPGYPRKACLAFLTNTEQWESGLKAGTHSGAVRGGAGERCLMQLHRTVTAIPSAKYRITRAEWEGVEGVDLEHTRNCVRLGMRVARWHIFRCGLRYEPGGWIQIAQLYNEYHRPSARCRAVPSPLSGRRAMAYEALVRKIGRMEGGS